MPDDADRAVALTATVVGASPGASPGATPGTPPRRTWRRRLLLASSAVVVVEVAVAVAVAEWIGYPLMVLALIAVSFAGLWVVKAQGLAAFSRVGADLARARPPGRGLVDGLLTVMAGLLLLVPGFVTDLVAVVLLVPLTRRLARNALIARWSRRLAGRGRAVLAARPGR